MVLLSCTSLFSRQYSVLHCPKAWNTEQLAQQPDPEGEGQVDDHPDEEDVDEILQDPYDADDDRPCLAVEEKPAGSSKTVKNRPQKGNKGDSDCLWIVLSKVGLVVGNIFSTRMVAH